MWNNIERAILYQDYYFSNELYIYIYLFFPRIYFIQQDKRTIAEIVLGWENKNMTILLLQEKQHPLDDDSSTKRNRRIVSNFRKIFIIRSQTSDAEARRFRNQRHAAQKG